MPKFLIHVPRQQKWPLWCFAQGSVAWVRGGDKDLLFGDSPTQSPRNPSGSPTAGTCLDEKSASVVSAPRTRPEAPSVPALRGVAGETGLLPGREGSRRGGNARAPAFTPELKAHQMAHSLLDF